MPDVFRASTRRTSTELNRGIRSCWDAGCSDMTFVPTCAGYLRFANFAAAHCAHDPIPDVRLCLPDSTAAQLPNRRSYRLESERSRWSLVPSKFRRRVENGLRGPRDVQRPQSTGRRVAVHVFCGCTPCWLFPRRLPRGFCSCTAVFCSQTPQLAPDSLDKPVNSCKTPKEPTSWLRRRRGTAGFLQ